MPTGHPRNLLFCSAHNVTDTTSGAAVSASNLLRLLAARGWSCRVICGSQTDGVAASSAPCEADGVTVDVLPSADPQALGDALRRSLRSDKPDLLLTYGGGDAGHAIAAAAREAGVPLVFWLCSLGYTRRETFDAARLVIVHSHFVADHYARLLGLSCVAPPPPIDWPRVTCGRPTGRCVTFVNPEPQKGVYLFVAICNRLATERRDISFLVVEARGGAEWLVRAGLDCRANVRVMPNASDPRAFYAMTRLLLVPSAWQEPFGMVAVEAMINGIVPIVSRRGGLAEAVGTGGIVLDTPNDLPLTAPPPDALVDAWVSHILRLFDDPTAHRTWQAAARRRAADFDDRAVVDRYEQCLGRLLS